MTFIDGTVTEWRQSVFTGGSIVSIAWDCGITREYHVSSVARTGYTGLRVWACGDGIFHDSRRIFSRGHQGWFIPGWSK